MASTFYFTVSVPSDDGNLCYEIFDTDFVKFCKTVFKTTILNKITWIDPNFCIKFIKNERHILGVDQKMQFIADKMLDFATIARNKNLRIRVLFAATE